MYKDHPPEASFAIACIHNSLNIYRMYHNLSELSYIYILKGRRIEKLATYLK